MSDVVADTSPLQYLHQLRYLQLLPERFTRVFVPPAVIEELAVGRRSALDLPDLESHTWISSLAESPAIDAVPGLGPGERQVLAFASANRGMTALLDDAAARRAARRLNVPVLGTVGLLLWARRTGRLAALGPVLDRLEQLGSYLDPGLRATALRLAGESMPDA